MMNPRTARFATLLMAFGLSGCSAFNYAEPDSPVSRASATALTPNPRVALVLGGSGPREYAQIGVLKVLQAAALEGDLVVGSGVGSLIGAFRAYGYDASDLDWIARSGGPLTLFDLSPFADRGWIHGQRLQDYVSDNLGNASLEHLPRRLIVAATPRTDKQPVFFERGTAAVAIRASSAVPGIISPVGIQGVEYEDADESLPVAVRAARDAGAQFVIAVDVSARPGKAPPGMSSKTLNRDARRRARVDPEKRQADFAIHPDMDYAASPRASYFRQAQVAGEVAARQLLPDLLETLRSARLLSAVAVGGDAGQRPTTRSASTPAENTPKNPPLSSKTGRF
jgi:NTE family protein